MLVNPFHELYLGDTASDTGFVRLFSPVLLPYVSALYSPGNIALVGSQGNGKSMLLGLLRPEVRVAYDQSDMDYPLGRPFSNFVGAGINIIQSPAKDFGQRISGEMEPKRLSLLFGDYINYWLVGDLLASVKFLWMNASQKLLSELGMEAAEANAEHFAKVVSRDPCWFGYLARVDSFDALELAIHDRLEQYRNYLNFNLPGLPDQISSTTTSVGSCVSAVATCLRSQSLIGRDVNVFARIDQVDSLLDLAPPEGDNGMTLRLFRQVLNKLLGQRDPVISYKLGVRPFAWKSEMRIFGTGVGLEMNRDFVEVDLDRLLQRPENTRTWVFPKLAEDVFRRRLLVSGFSLPKRCQALQYVLGSSLKPSERARLYVPMKSSRWLDMDRHWPEDIKASLRELSIKNPLDAQLACAWIRQKGVLLHDTDGLPSEGLSLKTWWVKERRGLALLQIAAKNKQRLIWSGRHDVIQLSGYNVLSLLRIYRGIWDAWLQDTSEVPDNTIRPAPRAIHPDVQTAGIEAASDEWHEKLSIEPGSDVVMRFADYLGSMYRRDLAADAKMSNPGHNGFSLAIVDLTDNPDVQEWINRAAGFAVLSWQKHTSKEKDKKLRRKYYLNALLAPFYQIPAGHTKEPEYVSVGRVREWLVGAGLLTSDDAKRRRRSEVLAHPSFEELLG
jgi:hypothetical protein